MLPCLSFFTHASVMQLCAGNHFKLSNCMLRVFLYFKDPQKQLKDKVENGLDYFGLHSVIIGNHVALS
jgi:hypothetical protein